MRKTRPPLLTKAKRDWVGQFKPDALRGKTLNYNAAVSERYDKELQTLIEQMASQVERAIVKLFKGEAAEAFAAMDASLSSQARILTNALTATFTSLFSRRAKAMAERMADGSLKTSKSSLHGSLKELSGGLSLKTGIVPERLQESFSAVVTENVGLIKTIPATYLAQVQGAVMRSLQPGGNGLQDLVPFLQARKEITKRHARNIALDQTRKAFNAANTERMKAVGVKKFEWIHSGGGAHPREDHVKMNGNIYSFDALPVIGVMYGVEVRGIPGQLPNCRCTMRPVIEFNEGTD